MNSFQHEVTEQEVNERLDRVLVPLNNTYSRQQIQTWIKKGNVHVNGRHVKPNYRCKKGDVLTWTIEAEEELEIKAEHIPLSIVYEDESLIVLNKPQGMLVHPTAQQQSGTLVNALMNHTENLSTVGGPERPGIVHRLDQHTGGIMVVCKDDRSHLHLQRQFQEKTVTRIYETIVHGWVAHEKGIIKAPIGRNPHNRVQMAVVPAGKEAETHFRVLGRSEDYTYVQCRLITGRMHQIRVHMNYMKHPIVGDPIYNRKQSTSVKQQALYAKTLGFIHPKTERYVEFSVDRPEMLTNLLNVYRIKS